MAYHVTQSSAIGDEGIQVNWGPRTKFTRRRFLESSLITMPIALTGFGRTHSLEPPQKQGKGEPRKLLGTVEFAREGSVTMDTVSGAELDGRLFTDLSTLTPENTVTPSEKFYIRTRASKLLKNDTPWTIRLGGLVSKPFDVTADHLARLAKPMGVHLMECSGNARSAHFGMVSVAAWEGVPITDILRLVKSDPRATRVLVSGFDTYSETSTSSKPGASWIFRAEDLKSANAFLATAMNRLPLTRDHGAPVRLVVPNWYGCACIKWVNEIAFTDAGVETTSHMREFASRTLQAGVPELAKDYTPASIEQAAMPIRVEKWLADGRVFYSIVGILWGGSRPVDVLEIRFNPEEDYVPVLNCAQTANDPWSFWTHAWLPKKTGTYIIRLRVRVPVVTARRLDAGYYARSVEISEI